MCDQDEPKTLLERMRQDGVTYQELFNQFMGDGQLLADTLSGLSLLDIGYAQPDMGDAEFGPDIVWDGAFVWHDDRMVMTFDGRSGPSGDGEPRSMAIAPDTRIMLY